MNKSFEWICLDLGGVLHDDRGTLEPMLVVAAQLLGLSVDEVRKRHRAEKSLMAVLRQAAAGAGADDWSSLLQGFRRGVVEALEDADIPPYAGVPEALDRLSGGYKLALASNTLGLARPWLEHHGLTGHFTHLHLAGEVGYNKPRPEFFAGLIEATGVAPGEILMVGDRIVTDCAPALEAGTAAVLIRRYERRLEGYEDYAERLWAEVRDLDVLAQRLGR